MKKKWRYSLLFIVAINLLYSFTSLHDFYISITSIDYNNETNKLEITSQFTTHDIEKAILSGYDIDLNLGEPNEYIKADSILFDFIVSNFSMNASSSIDYVFIGKETNLDETLWVYFESKKIEKPKQIEIINTFLIDDFESQSNITHVNFGDKQLSYSFNRLNKKHIYKIKL